MAMVMCCLPSISAMQVDGQPQGAVTCDPSDLISFIRKETDAISQMYEEAEMFEDRIYDRTKALFEYFGLPFETAVKTVQERS